MEFTKDWQLDANRYRNIKTISEVIIGARLAGYLIMITDPHDAWDSMNPYRIPFASAL